MELLSVDTLAIIAYSPTMGKPKHNGKASDGKAITGRFACDFIGFGPLIAGVRMTSCGLWPLMAGSPTTSKGFGYYSSEELHGSSQHTGTFLDFLASRSLLSLPATLFQNLAPPASNTVPNLASLARPLTTLFQTLRPLLGLPATLFQTCGYYSGRLPCLAQFAAAFAAALPILHG